MNATAASTISRRQRISPGPHDESFADDVADIALRGLRPRWDRAQQVAESVTVPVARFQVTQPPVKSLRLPPGMSYSSVTG